MRQYYERVRSSTIQLELPDDSQAWIIRAQSDLALAELAQKTSGIVLEDACFHAQQCAEKALKALLLHLNVDFPRTHTIGVLIELIRLAGIPIPDYIDRSFVLSQYAVETRYPGEWEPVTEEETFDAIDMAAQILNWVEEMLCL